MFKGRRVSFTLGHGNKEVAAQMARDIYGDLLALGVEATLKKHRAQAEAPKTIATVGAWIAAAETVSDANPATFNCYAASLRKIVGDILGIKRSKSRFGPKKGGAKDYRATIEAASLEVLTLEAVQKWRLEYVRQADAPDAKRSRMTSCNSTVRQARSLFARKIVKFLPPELLPSPPPFHDVERYPAQNTRYLSKIDAETLIQSAHNDLAEVDPSVFLALLLSLSTGLRRAEIDSLCWHQIDFKREVVRIERTSRASLKSEDSRGEVPIDADTVAILRKFHKRALGTEFVIDAKGVECGPRRWGRQYRANAVWKRVIAWLRTQNVNVQKPLHELRKELGSLITDKHGIYGASRVLRHANVETTARHYVDSKTRSVVNVGAWLKSKVAGDQAPEPGES